MLSVNVKTTGFSRTVAADITATPKEVLDEVGYDYSRSLISLKGFSLRGDDLNKSFESYGVEDGSAVNLTCVVKADGAR